MDYALIATAASSLKAAIDVVKAAGELKDSNKFASEISKVNVSLLEAQNALFTHNAQLHQMQDELHATKDLLRSANEKLAERDKYDLTEVGSGSFAYRSTTKTYKDAAQAIPNSPHYLCQPCFDSGRKAVLHVGESSYGSKIGDCPVCKVRLSFEW